MPKPTSSAVDLAPITVDGMSFVLKAAPELEPYAEPVYYRCRQIQERDGAENGR